MKRKLRIITVDNKILDLPLETVRKMLFFGRVKIKLNEETDKKILEIEQNLNKINNKVINNSFKQIKNRVMINGKEKKKKEKEEKI